jgi:hypothetical protein
MDRTTCFTDGTSYLSGQRAEDAQYCGSCFHGIKSGSLTKRHSELFLNRISIVSSSTNTLPDPVIPHALRANTSVISTWADDFSHCSSIKQLDIHNGNRLFIIPEFCTICRSEAPKPLCLKGSWSNFDSQA